MTSLSDLLQLAAVREAEAQRVVLVNRIFSCPVHDGKNRGLIFAGVLPLVFPPFEIRSRIIDYYGWYKEEYTFGICSLGVRQLCADFVNSFGSGPKPLCNASNFCQDGNEFSFVKKVDLLGPIKINIRTIDAYGIFRQRRRENQNIPQVDGLDGVLIMFDTNDRKSYDKASSLYSSFRKKNAEKVPPMVLCYYNSNPKDIKVKSERLAFWNSPSRPHVNLVSLDDDFNEPIFNLLGRLTGHPPRALKPREPLPSQPPVPSTGVHDNDDEDL